MVGKIPVDPSRHRVTAWYLFFDRLYGVTDSGVITTIERRDGRAIVGQASWSTGHPAFGPGANADYISVVSGGKLYVLGRYRVESSGSASLAASLPRGRRSATIMLTSLWWRPDGSKDTGSTIRILSHRAGTG